MPYGPHTPDDRERMLAALGIGSVDDLFADIPTELRASALELPPPEPELELSARLRGLTRWETRARDLLERFELGDAAHRVTGGFSHGMGRRLSVVLAILHDPGVVLLDEPFDGVDPVGVEATLEAIADARARGACILISTHLRELAIQACSSVLVLRGGSRVATVDASEMAGEEGARAYRALLD